MPQKLLIATHNKGKLGEFSRFLSDLRLQTVSLSDVGIHEDVDEDGETYEENATKKALFYARKSGLPAVADDGGLEIRALGGAPGIRSRRWIGDSATDEQLLNHLQKVARGLPENNRHASFLTAVVFAMPDGRVWVERGEVEGAISKVPFKTVSQGYPYRSFFYLPRIKKYYHEDALTEHEMQTYNHRLKAVRKLSPTIKRVLLETTV